MQGVPPYPMIQVVLALRLWKILVLLVARHWETQERQHPSGLPRVYPDLGPVYLLLRHDRLEATDNLDWLPMSKLHGDQSGRTASLPNTSKPVNRRNQWLEQRPKVLW
jgi:hypothetical protein